jgi:BirA family transcriptional regulator, biotin operon repressor / biotin---[acetyl-CoA-carboxylase] ligase
VRYNAIMTQPRVTQAQVELALAGLPLPEIRFLERTGSTNTDAAQWASQGAPDLALVAADEQTAGRGRLQRRWLTPPGVALAFSLVLRPDVSQEFLALILRHTALGALAVTDALADLGVEAEIKWPNDVLIQRRKTAGILVEAHWQGEHLEAIILGIGVNVAREAAPPDEAVIFPAGSIEHVLDRPVDRLTLLRAILERILFWRERLGDREFMQVWNARLAYKDEWVRISGLAEDQPQLEGKVLGLDASGGLRLVDERGQVTCLQTGELHLRPVDD